MQKILESLKDQSVSRTTRILKAWTILSVGHLIIFLIINLMVLFVTFDLSKIIEFYKSIFVLENTEMRMGFLSLWLFTTLMKIAFSIERTELKKK